MARDTTTNPRRWTAALAIAATTLATSAALAAAPSLPRLAVDRAPDAADCPDASALAAAVEQHMQRPALDPAATDSSSAAYEVRIFRSEDGYSATLQAGDLTRQFTDAGARCDELAGAIALTLAILLDSEPAVRPRSVAVVRKPARQKVEAMHPATRPRPLPGITADVGAAATFGLLVDGRYPFSAAFTGELAFRFSSVSLGVGVLGVPPRTFEVNEGTVRVWLVAFTGRLCADVAGEPDRVHVSACGQGMIGGVHGSGSGYVPDHEGSGPWLALGATGLVEGPIAGPVGWSVRATCGFPLLASAFTVGDPSGPGSEAGAVTAFSPWPIHILLGAGLRVTIQ